MSIGRKGGLVSRVKYGIGGRQVSLLGMRNCFRYNGRHICV